MSSAPPPVSTPRNLQFRAGLLLGLVLFIAVGFVLYVLYARGVFDATQRVTLITDNAEGVSIGMDLTYAGFPIGRVNRIDLGDDGRARIVVRVPVKDARWLRRSSIFTLERGIVGGARIRAFTGNLQDEPLPDGAERPVLRGDTSEEVPRMVASLRAVLQNLEEMTKSGGSVQASLGNVRTVTERLAGKGGVLSAALGSEEDARRVLALVDESHKVLANLQGSTAKLDSLLAKTDQRVFGEGGVADGAQKAVAQANALLADVRTNLQKVDKILADAQQAAANVRDTTANAKAATTDLGALRAEVDASLRRVSGLIDEINRKWPFKRDAEIKLP